MPCLWNSGNTETGPSPYQFGVPSEMITGENAICPTKRPSTSATSDTVRALAARELLRVVADLQSPERCDGHLGYRADIGTRLVPDHDLRVHRSLAPLSC